MSKFSDFEKRLSEGGYNYLSDSVMKHLRNPNQLLVFSHILRQYRMHKPKDGLVYYSRTEFAINSGISESSQKRALKILEDLGFIKTQYKGVFKKAHYELQYEAIEEMVLSGSKWTNKSGQNALPVSSKRSNKSGQNDLYNNNNTIGTKKYDIENSPKENFSISKQEQNFSIEKSLSGDFSEKSSSIGNGEEFSNSFNHIKEIIPVIEKLFPSLKELEQSEKEKVYNQINEVEPDKKKLLSIYLSHYGRDKSRGKKVETDFLQFIEKVFKPAKDVNKALDNLSGMNKGKG